MTPDLAAHGVWLAPYLTVVKPEGPGPFPVVVQLHGCNGCGPMQTVYAQIARRLGVAAVIVDSLAPRRIGPGAAATMVCTGLRLRGAERAIDFLAVLAWLEDQAWADTSRLAAAGWSHGGWTLMEAMAGLETDDGVFRPGVGGVKLTALFYPYIGPPARTLKHGWGAARPKVFACLAGRDVVIGRRRPWRALRRLQADGLELSLLELPDATHAFDDDSAFAPWIIYRPDLAAQAHEAYAAALKGALFDGDDDGGKWLNAAPDPA